MTLFTVAVSTSWTSANFLSAFLRLLEDPSTADVADRRLVRRFEFVSVIVSNHEVVLAPRRIRRTSLQEADAINLHLVVRGVRSFKLLPLALERLHRFDVVHVVQHNDRPLLVLAQPLLGQAVCRKRETRESDENTMH